MAKEIRCGGYMHRTKTLKIMKYNVGDKVQLVKTRPKGWNWNGKMDGFLGKIVTLTHIDEEYGDIKFKGSENWFFQKTDILRLIKTNKMKNTQTQTIKKVANALLKANNTVTTLEIKVELRKKYPKQSWKQTEISQAMDNFYAQGDFNYNDNGTYRVYSAVKTPTVVNPVVKTVVASKKSSTQKVSKTKALELIQKVGGRFFGVTFTKKDGTVREMKCRIEKHNTKPTNFGYLLVLDVEDNTPKSLNLQTVSELRMNKNVYKVA